VIEFIFRRLSLNIDAALFYKSVTYSSNVTRHRPFAGYVPYNGDQMQTSANI